MSRSTKGDELLSRFFPPDPHWLKEEDRVWINDCPAGMKRAVVRNPVSHHIKRYQFPDTEQLIAGRRGDPKT